MIWRMFVAAGEACAEDPGLVYAAGMVRASAVLLVLLAACSSPAAPVSPPPAPVVAAPSAPPVPATVPPASAATPTAAVVTSASVTPPTAPTEPRARVEGFDVRATFWSDPLFVLSRPPAGAASGEGEPLGDDTEADTLVRWVLGPASGDPVRVVRSDGSCEGTLGRRVRIEAPWLDVESPQRAAIGHEVTGCPGPALFAIVHPTPGAAWPEALADSDAAAGPALEAARAAATDLVRGSSAESFDARAYRLGGSVYGLAWGPRCAEDDEMGCGPAGSALVVVDPGQAPRTLIVRPVHFPWDEATGAAYVPCGVTDVDGDGAVELCEQMQADQGSMLRLVRPGERRAGEMVWRVEETAEYTLPRGSTPPPPLEARSAPPP